MGEDLFFMCGFIRVAFASAWFYPVAVVILMSSDWDRAHGDYSPFFLVAYWWGRNGHSGYLAPVFVACRWLTYRQSVV